MAARKEAAEREGRGRKESGFILAVAHRATPSWMCLA